MFVAQRRIYDFVKAVSLEQEISGSALTTGSIGRCRKEGFGREGLIDQIVDIFVCLSVKLDGIT